MTEIRIDLNIRPESIDRVTQAFQSVPGVLAAHQPAFKRLIAERLDARQADQIIADIKAIGNYDAGQVGDINRAIRFSQFVGSVSSTANYIKDQVLAGVELQVVLDDVMGN